MDSYGCLFDPFIPSYLSPLPNDKTLPMRENVTRFAPNKTAVTRARRWKFSKTPVRGMVRSPSSEIEPNNLSFTARSICTGVPRRRNEGRSRHHYGFIVVTLPPPRTTLVNAGETTGGRAGWLPAWSAKLIFPTSLRRPRRHPPPNLTGPPRRSRFYYLSGGRDG